MKRQFRYVIYRGLGGSGDASGEEVLGEWFDGPAPKFRHGLNGATELTVKLPRAIGYRDDNSEGADDTIVCGESRVDVYVADDWSLQGDSNAGRLVFRGTIEQIAGLATLDLTIFPLSHVYDRQYFAASAAYTNLDPLEVARTLVVGYGGAVPWDETNALGTGVIAASVTFKKAYLMDAIRACAAAAGATWHAFVSPQGQVRFLDDAATGTTTHHLTHGRNCAANLDGMAQSTMERARRIFLFYTDTGGVERLASATANDFDSDFPRDYLTTWNDRISPNIADAIAASMLVEMNRVTLSLDVTVDVADYDIDSIAIGHRIQLRIPRPFPAVEVAQVEGGYAEINVRVSEIEYRGHSVVLSLDTPTISMSRLIGQAQNELRQLAVNALAPV